MLLRVALLLALSPLSGCCTILATAISPITGPVDAVRYAVEHYTVGEALWKVPLMILLSPVCAFFVGLGADCEFVANGKYAHDAPERIGRPWDNMPGH